MAQTESDKPTLRRALRTLLNEQITPERRHEKSLAATALLVTTPEFAHARVVMLYLSTPHELDTSTLALRCWQGGKTVVVPKVSWEQRRMMPVEITSLSDEHLTLVGPGIREPREANPVPVELVDLVVVPALGFSTAGHRLGRGMGFYDRFLSQPSFKGASCGLAFEEQVVPALATQPHDVPVGLLVTDRAVRRFRTSTVIA